MNETRYAEPNGRTLADVVSEIKDELKEFIQTRVQMFSAEMKEKLSRSKSVALYGGLAALLLGTAYLLLTLALVGLVAVAFWGSPYAWFLAFLIVGVGWAILGGTLALVAKRTFRGFTPQRTIQVLKQDKVWLQREASNQP